MAKCWKGAEVWPYQASLVMFTRSSEPWSVNCRTTSGKMAS